MSNTISRLRQPITSNALDASIGAVAFYVAGAAFFVLGALALTRADVTREQLLFGLFLTIAVAMQMIVAGLVLDLRRSIVTGRARGSSSSA